MKSLNQYRIPFKGLGLGKHDFEFKIGKPFFDEFEYSIVKDGDLDLRVTIDKQEIMIVAHFEIKGTITLTCDICLSQFPGKTTISERLIVKFSEDEDLENSTEEIMVLGKNEYELNIADVVYEYINLSVPYYSRCDQQGENITCDQTMINKLNSLSVAEKAQHKNKAQDSDPRWDILKNIKNN